jgi:hypothetical protein
VATAAVTYNFTALTQATAAEVNQNFDDLVTFLNDDVIHVDGSKAFTAVPSGPASNPTTDNQLTRKAYVDAYFTGPTAVSVFTNSWVNFNAGSEATARYSKVGSIVILEGIIKSGTIGQPAFTLPAGYRPPRRIIAVCGTDGGGTATDAARLDIETDGDVIPQSGSNSYISFFIPFSVTA